MGGRDPRLLAVLAGREPASVVEKTFGIGPYRLSSYLGVVEVPDDLVVSIRVLVQVGGDVVVCTNADERCHAWPGGRREPGETHVETACREVHEETGWLLDPRSVEPLGVLLLENLGEPFGTYPFPDALHLVMAARAGERAAEEWTDTEGYELSSRLVALEDAAGCVSVDEPMCIPFLELLRARA